MLFMLLVSLFNFHSNSTYWFRSFAITILLFNFPLWLYSLFHLFSGIEHEIPFPGNVHYSNYKNKRGIKLCKKTHKNKRIHAIRNP